ncbi:MAG: histidine phosphatase family protein [Pseudomonadota bacterium]
MARELLILRHGKSDWSEDADDFHRPLKDRGKRAAQRTGVWLEQQGLLPDYIISSPAVRALETARKISKAMGMDSRQIKQEQAIYAASLSELLGVLGNCPKKAGRVMIVGHNPGFENLLTHLSKTRIPLPKDANLLPTATLARLKLPDDWRGLKAGCGELQSITRPKNLPKIFPFPDFKGEEQRDRPAYYYTQSSVIPYRMQGDQPEILVVMSSQNKHWVVPKGISDPGMTLQESAAKEALEEAGIEGEVESLPLGSYTCEKWGAECTVHVYPMIVTHVLDESVWEERHRGREWLSPDQAMKKVRQTKLKPMIEALVKQLKSN